MAVVHKENKFKYLNYIQSGDEQVALSFYLMDAGFKVKECTSYKVVTETSCEDVEITWEMCSCHGGRVWVNTTKSKEHKEFSCPYYDESNGIVDPETELCNTFETSLIEYLKDLQNYVFHLTQKNVYSKSETTYTNLFKTLDALSRSIFEGSKDEKYPNAFSFDSCYEKLFPNPDRKDIYIFEGIDKGVHRIKSTSLCRKDKNWVEDGSYKEYEFFIFDKKPPMHAFDFYGNKIRANQKIKTIYNDCEGVVESVSLKNREVTVKYQIDSSVNSVEHYKPYELIVLD